MAWTGYGAGATSRRGGRGGAASAQAQAAAAASMYAAMPGYDTMDYSGYGMGGEYDYTGNSNADVEGISFTTNSQDPTLMASRIFVGNLNTQIIGREKLLKMYLRYGTILGCTCFKGYSFIQFQTPTVAQAAINATNGMVIAGQHLDVKLACENAKIDPGKLQGHFTGPPAAKRGKVNTMQPGMMPKPIKRPAPPISDNTAATDLMSYESEDTLVCGNCDKVFRDWVHFRDHRSSPCTKSLNGQSAAKDERPDQPETVGCFVCKENFTHCWDLLKHLSEHHRLTVYVDDKNPEQSGTNELENFLKTQ